MKQWGQIDHSPPKEKLPSKISALLWLKRKRQHFVNTKSTSFLNSESKVSLPRVTETQFLYESNLPSTN